MRAFDVKGPGLGFRGLGIKVLGFLNLGFRVKGPGQGRYRDVYFGFYNVIHLKGLGCGIYRL